MILSSLIAFQLCLAMAQAGDAAIANFRKIAADTPLIFSSALGSLSHPASRTISNRRDFGRLAVEEPNFKPNRQSKPLIETAIAATGPFYKQGQRAAPDYQHEVIFALKQKNIPLLEAFLLEVSDPDHPSYGNYKTREEVAALTANPDATAAVESFLKSNGVSKLEITPFGEYIKAEAPISMWEQIFSTTFFQYSRSAKNARQGLIVRTSQYSLPGEIAAHVSTVFNTVQFEISSNYFAMPSTKQNSHRGIGLNPSRGSGAQAAGGISAAATSVLNPPTGVVNPAFLNKYYNITSNTGSAQVSQAVYESLSETLSTYDLYLFQTTFNLPQESFTDIGGYVDTYCYGGSNCAEANLDVQYMMGISQVTPTTYYYDSSSSFTDWIMSVAAMTNPPNVFSISYASIEWANPYLSMEQFNTEAAKLGAQGTTLVASSGDDGVANFIARYSAEYCGYNPSWPQTSPYVTVVGATQGPESGTPVVACQSQLGAIITSGGGFSDYFPTPSWQMANVAAYLQSVQSNPSATGYNAGGRAYPDVAALGFNYQVVINGSLTDVSGTSASSPVVAAMISLVNAARKKARKPLLGWLNPLLYKYGNYFMGDVTSGSNNCAALGMTCCSQGFSAAVGWDPVTGLGQINYKKLVNLAAAPTNSPIPAPSPAPTSPTVAPSRAPTSPSVPPSSVPTSPTAVPSAVPSSPTIAPSPVSTNTPTTLPSRVPTIPTTAPSPAPTSPTVGPSPVPTSPSAAPSPVPTSPTAAPSPLPTYSPAFKPTAYPSLTAFPTVSGSAWVYLNEYVGPNCSSEGSLFASQWIPSVTCTPIFDSSGAVDYYAKISCFNGVGGAVQAVAQAFSPSQPTCAGSPAYGQEYLSTTCAQQNYYIYGQPQLPVVSHTLQTGCVLTAGVQPPLPPGTYAVETLYDAATCSGTVYGQTYYTQGVCYNLGYEATSATTYTPVSVKAVWPNYYVYLTPSCTGTPYQTKAVPTGCNSNLQGDDDSAIFTAKYVVWSQVVISSSSSSSSSSSGISKGAVFGIVCACVLLVLGVLTLVYNFGFSKPSQAQPPLSQQGADVEMKA